jgi:hypothetical protein
VKIKEFLVQLEDDPALLDKWRKAKKRNERKQIAEDEGLTDAQADVISSTNLKKIKQAIEDENGGGQIFCIVMVE